MGRYEWTVVGRDAASVDSAGASLVTAAFKNKQVEIGLAGEDMYDPLITNQMPLVMAKMDEGNVGPLCRHPEEQPYETIGVKKELYLATNGQLQAPT
jgi:hypothetical protein